MTLVAMNKFGRTLTDRPDGKKAYETIVADNAPPYILDFKGVMSLGSSFGDEVVIRLAQLQSNQIKIVNINDGIRACIKRVTEGTTVRVDMA